MRHLISLGYNRNSSHQISCRAPPNTAASLGRNWLFCGGEWRRPRTRQIRRGPCIRQILKWQWQAFKHLKSLLANVAICCPGLEKEGQESKISLPCWAVLTSLPVFLSGLWVSPLLLFSAKDQFEKERHDVGSWYIPAREWDLTLLFLFFLVCCCHSKSAGYEQFGH